MSDAAKIGTLEVQLEELKGQMRLASSATQQHFCMVLETLRNDDVDEAIKILEEIVGE